MEINYGFYVTLTFIVIVLPTISFFVGRFSSLALEFGGASLSLLVALFVQLFNVSDYSNSMLFALLISAILHGAALPFLIVLTKVHSKDESFIWAIAAFPFSLLLANGLLFLTASMTLHSATLLNLYYEPDESSTKLVEEIFKGDSFLIFWTLVAILIMSTLARMYFLKKKLSGNGVAVQGDPK